jgi:hypothetical protein
MIHSFTHKLTKFAFLKQKKAFDYKNQRLSCEQICVKMVVVGGFEPPTSAL